MIPTYNQDCYILEAVESALKQDYSNIEIIISDDGSIDGTADLVEPYLGDRRIKYFKNIRNIGRVANYRRTLFERTTGDWIVNLDGDDYFTDSRFISRAMNSIEFAMSSGNDIVAYIANHHGLSSIEKRFTSIFLNQNEVLISGRDYFLNYTKIGSFTHLGSVYNRDKALQLDFYSENILSADFFSVMRLTFHGSIILSDYKIGVWRKHKNNASQNNVYLKYEENIEASNGLLKRAALSFTEIELNNWKHSVSKYFKEQYVFDIIANSNQVGKYFMFIKYFAFKMNYFVFILSLIKKDFIRLGRFFQK
jgi:glycosyltransferase involved in cell wall biosynthesis